MNPGGISHAQAAQRRGAIRRAYAAGATAQSLALLHGVTDRMVYLIAAGGQKRSPGRPRGSLGRHKGKGL